MLGKLPSVIMGFKDVYFLFFSYITYFFLAILLIAVRQHRQLWERTFRENKKLILESVEPTDILPYLPYLPRDRIRAVCNNQGRTRGADELVESLFQHTDKSWMKDFIDALRTKRINQHLVADLLTHKFRDQVDKTVNDPKFKDLHDVYAKAERRPDKEGKKQGTPISGIVF